MPQEQTGVKERQRTRLREPKRYKVILHNDDFTTMEFVVMLLAVVFHKTEAEAERIMLNVHHKGKGTAGVYPYDIAVTKAQKSTSMAREAGFPLRLSVEPAE